MSLYQQVHNIYRAPLEPTHISYFVASVCIWGSAGTLPNIFDQVKLYLIVYIADHQYGSLCVQSLR